MKARSIAEGVTAEADMFNHSTKGGRIPTLSLNTEGMKQYISEGRAIYEDQNHGMFSKRLAEWAISHMMAKDPSTREMRPIEPRSIDDVQQALAQSGIELPEDFIYTAWYLFNMAVADYPKSLTTDEQRAAFVDETLCDPDCCPEAVLECFVAKMCLMGKPIYWERML